MFRYGYLLLALTMGAACLFAFWRLWRQSTEDRSTTLMDYLLVWPLVLRAERQSKKPTRRWFVVVGILVYLAVLIAGQFIGVRRHG